MRLALGFKNMRQPSKGPEIIGDPGFDGTGSYWTVDLGVSVAGGKGVWAAATSGNMSHTGAVSPGARYQFTYTVDSVSGGTGIVVTLGGVKGTPRAAAGTYTETIFAGSANTSIVIGNDTTAITAQIDNASLRMLP